MPDSTPSSPSPDPADRSPVLLEVEELVVRYPLPGGFFRRSRRFVEPVQGVSFRIRAGQTVGLVGESGSGKTTIGKAVVRLVPPHSGAIRYRQERIDLLSGARLRPYRKRVQMIFQDPHNSLNPRLTIARIVGEPLEIHFPALRAAERRDRAAQLLARVGLPADSLDRYPHEFSGGQRQRIGIARALAVEPELLVCDEPVSALDVSVQAQIVNLLQDLQQDLGLAYLFISHDLAVVEHLSDEVLVLHEGKIVEAAPAEELYRNPKNEYTRKLLASIPSL
ncbi:Oligopeptide transport ATP-binding protein OppF [Methylacidimicrobium cyclopophantes]|uniref:Oligopeptide transport ATP-binding protein OppF n=1 Tax=Methylacidimicrobium cyclopophantes TaxID=1041766 RepID=A0A5E6MEV1_9BACT|nr:ATP-binding cassette domain-containing protein [Methylacidimicrobium cyclopophantes]VVM07645.1 Oligopeptide transport ATP-binding protein OppF [Methylacidimicrobium cyclopophantes]